MPPRPSVAVESGPKSRAVRRVEFTRPQNFYGTMLTSLEAGEKTDPVHALGPSIATPIMHVDLATQWLYVGDAVYPLPSAEVRRIYLAKAAVTPAK